MPDSDRKTWEEAVRGLLDQEDQQSFVRDCYFDSPLLGAATRFRDSSEWAATRLVLPSKPGRALDVGAGRGIASFALARDGWHVTALEPDPSELVGAGAIRDLARESAQAIEVVEDFGEELPFQGGTFDLVYCRQVLHHARSLRHLCAELFRVLKPGGALVAVRDHVVSSPRQLGQFQAKHPLHRFYGGENAFRLQVYLEALLEAGFIDLRSLGPFATAINFAPLSRDQLRARIQTALRRFPVGRPIAAILNSDSAFEAALTIMNRLDRRPGRLHTFLAKKGGS